jgi:hypothetical protein
MATLASADGSGTDPATPEWSYGSDHRSLLDPQLGMQ